MMVKERRITFTAGDIISIRVQCAGCRGEVVRSLHQESVPFRECPFCARRWDGDFQPATELFRVLRRLAATDDQEDTPLLRVRMELDDSPAP